MTTNEAPLCPAYDQLSDRKCRYYADHGGKHNFARLGHDSSLERELRRALDEMAKDRDHWRDACAPLTGKEMIDIAQDATKLADEEILQLRAALGDALDLFDANWCTDHCHMPSPETFARAAELGKKLGRKPDYP